VNILFIHQGYELYGSDRILMLNVRAVKASYPKNEVVVLLPRNGALAEAMKAIPGVTVAIRGLGIVRRYDLKRLRLKFLWRILTFPRLIRMMNRYKLVYINSVVVADCILAARFCRSKTIVHIHEIPSPTARRFFNPILRFSHADLLFVSEACRRGFGISTGRKQVVLPNGCAPLIADTGFLKDPSKFGLLILGRISKAKGQWLLLESLAQLDTEIREKIQVKVVGDVYGEQPHLIDSLKELADIYSLRQMISFHPFSPQPDPFYHWSDAVVIPSLTPESFGLVAIEAMSAGKPVIAASHGGLAEIVVDGKTGILFEPGNPQALSEAITYALHNPDKMQQMGQAGKQRYLELFTEEIYIRNFQKII
jgi:glycosyltransferase involved in cell wall biosynthesis